MLEMGHRSGSSGQIVGRGYAAAIRGGGSVLRGRSALVLLAAATGCALEARQPEVADTRQPGCDEVPCAQGLVCVLRTCVVPHERLETCVLDVECADGLTCYGSECLHDGTVKQGGECVHRAECADGLQCHSVEAICQEPRGEGGSCGQWSDCALGLSCNIATGGTCAPPGETGAPCGVQADCRTGLLCNTALGGQCAPRGPAGAPCAFHSDCQPDTRCNKSGGLCATGFEGASCRHDGDCWAGLWCKPGAPGSGSLWCSRDGLEDEPCVEQGDCHPHLQCVRFEGEEDYFGGKAPDEQRCVCRDQACPLGESCGAIGCVRLHTVAAGGVCEHNANCGAGLICGWDVRPHICRLPSEPDEPCGHPTDCAAGLWCLPGKGCFGNPCGPPCASGELCSWAEGAGTPRCLAPQAEGAECAEDRACAVGLVCLGTCATPSGPGGACSNPRECLPGLECLGETCQPTLPDGADCSPTLPPRCEPGLKCNPLCHDQGCDVENGVCGEAPSLDDRCACPVGFQLPHCDVNASLYGSTCVPGLICSGWPESRCL